MHDIETDQLRRPAMGLLEHDRFELRELLEQSLTDAGRRLREINKSLDGLLLDRRQDVADDEHDPEGVTLSAEWARLAGLRDEAQQHLKAIEDALSRCDEGTYGICSGCGEPIAAERLKIRPFATQCVRCAERAGG